MTTQIKYLVFKGISKKEEILFKSFLNLAKNELPYKVVVLKRDSLEADDPDILIVDDSYEFEEGEAETLSSLPRITVSDDPSRHGPNFIVRPVQWSEFKESLADLDVSSTEPEEEPERVLPDEVRMVIEELSESSEMVSDGTSGSEDTDGFEDYSNEGDYEYELDNLSVDYHSFTNSDYVRAADDVKQFKEEGESGNPDQVILVTNDESTSVNSVLVIETDSIDAWDFDDNEFTVSQSEHDIDSNSVEETEVVLVQRAGFEIGFDEEYWLEDNEIIIDNETFIFIKTAREMVYSRIEPGKWPGLLQRGSLSKLPLAPDWRPHSGLKVYPMSSFLWVNTLIRKTNSLAPGLGEEDLYLLEKWPTFDLLELDNVLLKLCTMLFVRPESVATLATKSGYARSTIRGLMNACHEMGYLKTPDQIDVTKLAKASNDEGMLGKIKDVFR